MTAPAASATGLHWHPVCRYADLLPERGVTALVAGEPVALFRTYEGVLHAVSNLDPFTGASVLSRGIVGDRAGRPTVASPLHKQVFDLGTGACLDDPAVAVRTYPVRERSGSVEIGVGAPVDTGIETDVGGGVR